MTVKAIWLVGISAAAFAAPALAHHSFAMFDATKTVEMAGVVKEFQWTNPHAWLIVTISDQQGKATDWQLEMGGPGGLARQGWRPKTVVPGDKVTVKHHPLKDGSAGGQFVSVVLPNGTTLGE